MDTIVVLVGDSHFDEEDDYACLHDLTGILKQDDVEGLRFNVENDEFKHIIREQGFDLSALRLDFSEEYAYEKVS